MKPLRLPEVTEIVLLVGPLKKEDEEIPSWIFWAIPFTSSKSQTKSQGMASWKPEAFVSPRGNMLHLAKEQQLHKQQREWLCYKRAKHLRPFRRTEVGEIL